MLTPRDEISLIECMCRSIIEAGGYCCALVDFARPDENSSAEPVAWWGVDPRVVASMAITWAGTPRSGNAAGAAIRRGTVMIVDDNLTNPDTARSREGALRRQQKAVMSLPLKVDDAVIGALTIFAAESESFGDEEVVQFTEVAAALSSGIAASRARAARRLLEVSLQSSEERFRAVTEASLDALLVLKSVPDAAGNLVDFEVTDMNGRARELGLAKGEVIGKTLFQLLPMYRFRTAEFFTKCAQVLATRTPVEEEFAFDAPGAERKRFRQRVVVVEDGVVVSLRDITA
jgi:PAS domain-containing protein